MEHYIEFFYPYNPDVADSMEDTLSMPVEERDPSLFIDIDEKNIIGFRFFDIEKGSNYMNRSNRKNISPIYYYGEYLSSEEIEYIHNIMPYTSSQKNMIQCYCGYLATDLKEGDITIEYYLKSLYKKENAKILSLNSIKKDDYISIS